jgi:class 3 adenylate cyclase
MLVCHACGHVAGEAFRFCPECGTPATSASGRGEQRKVVTVVFCDVTGSTELGESLDPEALRALLARYFERMSQIVDRHGGTVEKFIGDAVMAVFGVPVLHEDDALRAVRAASEMRAALPGLEVRGRIGVATGEVVTGTRERLATGDAVNVAARLQQSAQPGEVLVGEAEEQSAKAAELGASDDIATQMMARQVKAKVVARRGQRAEGEQLAREAVELARRTQNLSGQADAYADLGEVLALAGRPREAAGAYGEALARYERKGDVVSAERARRARQELLPASA